MVERSKKSTQAVQEVFKNRSESVLLDSRLALFEPHNSWLAISDLHYGYEVSRRAGGGLWPLWGRHSLETRVADLVADYQPKRLILNGDIVDSRHDFSNARQWLSDLSEIIEELILIRGNHDRGMILKHFEWVDQFQIGSLIFHHGHQDLAADKKDELIEVIGHIHPSYRFQDGAGLSLKLPTLVQLPTENRWLMPAFSPWAGGMHFTSDTEKIERWICSPKRVFKAAE